MSNYPSWITYLPLKRDWDNPPGKYTSRLCSVKAIAIHYVEAPGSSARAIQKYFDGLNEDVLEDNIKHDLTPTNQGSPFYGTHFIIDDSEILALAPSINYVFWQVGDYRINGRANTDAWDLDKTTFPRGVNFYTVGIEHCHPDSTGKFTPAVLKKSHQLVRWLLSQHGNNLKIGRHYDFTGKVCPKFVAPVLRGKSASYHRPDFEPESVEVIVKTLRWQKLLEYYRQADANNIPSELL
jgi:hypothetical protein